MCIRIVRTVINEKIIEKWREYKKNGKEKKSVIL